MGDPIAVLALRRKRDQISGIIAEYERKIKEAQHDLAHVVASLRLFELTGNPSDFPAYIDLNRLLRRGETTRLCLYRGAGRRRAAGYPRTSPAGHEGKGLE